MKVAVLPGGCLHHAWLARLAVQERKIWMAARYELASVNVCWSQHLRKQQPAAPQGYAQRSVRQGVHLRTLQRLIPSAGRG
jgi:hypothetical protein